MKETMSIKNIDKLLHQIALTARGAVMAEETTKEKIFEHVMNKGNEEFEKAFSMSEIEVCLTMLHELSEADKFDDFIKSLKGEDK